MRGNNSEKKSDIICRTRREERPREINYLEN